MSAYELQIVHTDDDRAHPSEGDGICQRGRALLPHPRRPCWSMHSTFRRADRARDAYAGRGVWPRRTGRRPPPRSWEQAATATSSPAAVRALTSRGEFATAYTPYQPEVSQGTLQHIFEFQTCVCELTGLDVANASLYDGPSALAEAAFMALRLTHREEIARLRREFTPRPPRWSRTYAAGPGLPVHELPLDPVIGRHGRSRPAALDRGRARSWCSSPTVFGVVEDLRPLAEAAHAAGALLVVSVRTPGRWGCWRLPGALGADIVVGDVQVFGNAPSFGGPSAGFLACRADHMRQIPGRLVGQTIDADGRDLLHAHPAGPRAAHPPGQGHLQHLLQPGPERPGRHHPPGPARPARACASAVRSACGAPTTCTTGLCALPGVRAARQRPLLPRVRPARCPCPPPTSRAAMRARGVDPGVPLARLVAGSSTPAARRTCLLVAVTEVNTPDALERYVAAARDVLERGRLRPIARGQPPHDRAIRTGTAHLREEPPGPSRRRPARRPASRRSAVADLLPGVRPARRAPAAARAGRAPGGAPLHPALAAQPLRRHRASTRWARAP